MDVTTYDVGDYEGQGMHPHADGEWVTLDDYKELQSAKITELAYLQIANERIEELEKSNKNRGAAVVLAQEVIAKNDKRIEELTKPYQSAEYWRETAEKALAEGAALEAALREEMERAQYRPEDIDEHIAGIKHSASTRRDIGQEILDGLKDLKRSQNKD